MASRKNEGTRTIATNRRARFDYAVIETWEAGLVLKGTEVKSLRDGKCTIGDAFVQVEEGQAWLMNLHIPEYTFGNRFNHEPKRRRKLLLHRVEIEKIRRGTEQTGYTCVPLELYFSNGYAKVKIALARGKKDIDRRHDEKEREDRREMRKYAGRG